MYSLLKISYYDFIDDETNKPVRGGKVTLMSNEPTTAENALGYDVDIKTVSYEVYQDTFNQLGSNPVFPVKVDVSIEGSLNKAPRIKGIKVVK